MTFYNVIFVVDTILFNRDEMIVKAAVAAAFTVASFSAISIPDLGIFLTF